LQNFKVFREGEEKENPSQEEIKQMEKIYKKYVSMGMFSENTRVIADSKSDNENPTYLDENAKLLIQNLSEMCHKVGKLLRLELWPQFCQSDFFLEFCHENKTKSKTAESPDEILRRKRPSLHSFYKNNSAGDLIIQVPKADEYAKFTATGSQELRTVDYIAIVSGSYTKAHSGKKGDLVFTAEMVKCFPEVPNPDFTLPNHIPSFCFPEKIGTRVDSNFKGKFVPTPPRLFNFVFNMDGKKLYGACLQFSELNLKDTSPHREARKSNPKEGPHLYAVCLVTRAPLFDSLRSLLIDVSHAPRKSNFLESPQFKILLQSLNQPVSLPIQKSLFALPKFKLTQEFTDLFSFDFDPSPLFKLVHPYKILSILEYLFLEKKVLLVSNQLSVSLFDRKWFLFF
jgi:hypothetical protein